MKTTQSADRPLVLASTSRYRRALLERLGVPFDVEPGQTGAIVMNLEDGCDGKLCDSWSLLSSIPTRYNASPSAALQVTWQLDVRAWRLVPDPAPMTLALDVR